VFPAILNYMGMDPRSETQGLQKAEAKLLSMRPYITSTPPSTSRTWPTAISAWRSVTPAMCSRPPTAPRKPRTG
jgi:hypothetical protein